MRLLVVSPQVSYPVYDIKKGEHDGEEDAGNDVNPLGPRGELCEPPLTTGLISVDEIRDSGSGGGC